MKIAILHLSDLHFKEANNALFEKEAFLFNAIKNEIDTCQYVFIVFTGDIAYSGKEKEYCEVKKFIDNFERKISDNNQDIKIEYIFAPGNHDCSFENSQSTRDMVIKTILASPKEIDGDIVETCTTVQKNYFDFIENFQSFNKINKEFSNKLLNRYEYKIGEHSIAFNSFNISWISQKNEQQSKIIFPLNQIEKNGMLNCKFALTFSLLHHPFHWLEHKNIREFKEFVETCSDIILTGHEHTQSSSQRKNIQNGNQTEHIEGGTLQDSFNKDISKFNLILIDLKSMGQDIFVFEWKEEFYEKIVQENLPVPSSTKTLFKMKQDYVNLIASLGLKINHPRKENTELEDLFVYPDLQVIDVNNNKTTNLFTEKTSFSLLNAKELNKSIIYGKDNSGKTTLGNILQIKYKESGFISIKINGSDITGKMYEHEKLKELIRKAFKSQYETNDKILSMFDQLAKDKIVLIIDDFQNIKFNSDAKSLFINALDKMKIENILILSNDNLQMEATSESLLSKSFQNYVHYQLLDFGHRLRDQLITKWIKLGQEDEIELLELSNKRREKANALTQTLGLNMVPSNPIYLLTLLQAMEINDSSLERSSFGHYYNYLILQYLNKNRSNPMEHKDIITIFTYLSTLAYKMFNDKIYMLSKDELNFFDRDYKKEKDFEPRFSILDKLIESGLLVEYQNEYRFSHKYIYYYFAAYFFSQNVDKEEIASIIEKMVKRLYRVEFANILMFIFHLAPKSHIINMLNSEAEKIFNNIAEFSFDKSEIIKINASIEKDTTNQLKNISLEESRVLELDSNEKETKIAQQCYIDDCYEADYNEEIQQLDFFKELNLAFKLIELLGEIVKNYSGSLDGDIKDKLIRNTYGMGLRSLKTIIQTIEDNHELLVEELVKRIDKKNIVTADKSDEIIHRIVFALVANFSTGIVKRISKAIGDKDLKNKYKRISDENLGNLAYKIIEYSVDLNFSGGLNKDKIEKLHKQLDIDKNILTDSTLKKLVLEHLYMFETSISNKMSICTKLGIDTGKVQKELLESKK